MCVRKEKEKKLHTSHDCEYKYSDEMEMEISYVCEVRYDTLLRIN